VAGPEKQASGGLRIPQPAFLCDDAKKREFEGTWLATWSFSLKGIVGKVLIAEKNPK